MNDNTTVRHGRDYNYNLMQEALSPLCRGKSHMGMIIIIIIIIIIIMIIFVLVVLLLLLPSFFSFSL